MAPGGTGSISRPQRKQQGSLPEVLKPPEKELVARLLKELRKGGVPVNQEEGQSEQPQELEHELPYGS